MRKTLFAAALVVGGLMATAGNASACWGWGYCGYGYGYGYYGYYGTYWGPSYYYAPVGYYYPGYYSPYYWGWGGYYRPYWGGWGWSYGQASGSDASTVVSTNPSIPATERQLKPRPENFAGVRKPVTEGQEESAVRLVNYPKPVTEGVPSEHPAASFAAFPSR